MKLAVVTICVGKLYEEIAAITHPTIKAYADRVGADFVVMRDFGRHKFPGYQKLEIGPLLYTKRYDRVLYVDTDILIRDDAPNLFDLVPAEQVGLLNEGKYVDRRQAKFNLNPHYAAWWTSDVYYNTGVMLVSRGHEMAFLRPSVEVNNFYEQTHLNLNIYRYSLPVFELPYAFNRMLFISRLTGESRLNAYFLHYAGQFSGGTDKAIIDLTISTMKDDLAAWRRGGWDPKEDMSAYD